MIQTMKGLSALLISVLLIGYLGGVAGAALSRSSPKIVWEYRSAQIMVVGSGRADEPARTLNQLGAEGWEFVHLRVDENAPGLGGQYLFKRAK